MMRRVGLLSMVIMSCVMTGCRGSLLLNPYANAVDDINDTHVYFDNWYCPRLDISRAGKPDWCGPFNSRLARNICYLGCYDRYDDCNLYPPANPYSFPSNVMPPPKAWTPTAHPEPMQPAADMPPAPAPSPVE